jgi:hypothetical protein
VGVYDLLSPLPPTLSFPVWAKQTSFRKGGGRRLSDDEVNTLGVKLGMGLAMVAMFAMMRSRHRDCSCPALASCRLQTFIWEMHAAPDNHMTRSYAS